MSYAGGEFAQHDVPNGGYAIGRIGMVGVRCRHLRISPVELSFGTGAAESIFSQRERTW
jgi:hypothetical protein